MSTRHTLSVLVENKPGVLTRVSGLFARRSFNIHSLAVGETEDPDLSRITVVVDAAELPLEQVTKQLNKLVNIIKIVELEVWMLPFTASFCWVKVWPQTKPVRRASGCSLRAHVVDMVPDAISNSRPPVGTTRSRPSSPPWSPSDIKELVQFGSVAIGRGNRSLSERVSAEMQLRRA